MFKLVLLSTIFAFALAHPGLYKSAAYSVPTYTSVAVHTPAYAQVGSVIKSVPSSVAHQSHSIVHNSAHVVTDVLAPAVKSTLYTTKSLAAPVYKSYAAPVYVKSYAAPIVYKSYAVKTPIWYNSW